MAELTEAEGIDAARERLGLESGTPARGFRVARPDSSGRAYYLIVFGEPEAALGIAAVDIATREVAEWATLAGTGPHTLIDAATAIRRAGGSAGSRAELIWRSSPASRSPLYPLWRVVTHETTVNVDQQGTVWPSLDARWRRR